MDEQRSLDESYMREALRIAEYARGRTSPNPLVGAVIVRDGVIVGSGWHRAAGEPHAEIYALRMADCPVVEGSVVAAVAAVCGAPLDEVVRRAEETRRTSKIGD